MPRDGGSDQQNEGSTNQEKGRHEIIRLILYVSIFRYLYPAMHFPVAEAGRPWNRSKMSFAGMTDYLSLEAELFVDDHWWFSTESSGR